MIQENYNVVGVMSGTSLDGVDMAHLHFSVYKGVWKYKILATQTLPYEKAMLSVLKTAVSFSAQELNILDENYTGLLSKMIANFITKNHLSGLDAVCSHGHTILHQPQNKRTLQIGNLPKIAQLTQQTVVCDFRIQDVLLGGQGAPLVPIGDKILFSEYDYCLNLGGFSNISFENKGVRIAFDISPVNTVLNFFANQLGLDYDDKGQITATGKVNTALLTALNDLPFYKNDFPKSLGFEFVKETILPLIIKYSLPIEDALCTFTEHVAQQIYLALPVPKGKMLVTGGGAYNDYLTARMRHYLPEIDVVIPEPKMLEYKEALIFGFLGVLKLRGENNVLNSVTGAKKDHCSGKVFYK